MPKRLDIRSILIIGSGPIVIGQACEFDYAGAQACKVLRREGYRVILVNSNPATIMTDPEFADATYIEPLTVEILEKIIAKEKPDAILPTVGAQTALNLAMDLQAQGVLARHNVKLIGANVDAIKLAEDRQLFKDAMSANGLKCPRGDTVTSVDEALELAKDIGYPVLIRPSFTLGGSGGGVAVDEDDLRVKCANGLKASPVSQVLIEQSVIGWKEFELEVMRDRNDNFVVVCSIENIDPMGIHTGDSVTVAPAMTLTDKELQRLRDMAKIVMRAVGVETGGSNVQFAVNPTNGETLVIEMNPRVSRSSALASKATGFPIAKIAALLAVGYTLDEIPNDITKKTPASFEPSIDYVVVKFPRWAFEKFPGADGTLGPQMKSVGEAMAIGRTFKEAFNKACQSLEIGRLGIEPMKTACEDIAVPSARRMFDVIDALRKREHVESVHAKTGFDYWFLSQFAEMIEAERELSRHDLQSLPADLFLRAKREGFGDAAIAKLLKPSGRQFSTESDVRKRRIELGIAASFYLVDTCAAEFESHTPYLYSNYDGYDESGEIRSQTQSVRTEQLTLLQEDNESSSIKNRQSKKIIILGGGPNRIGQGIEFDYCCVHACYALKELGFETIMVNCNPETVSTDYDTADRLFFEPLTLEHVLNVWETECHNASTQSSLFSHTSHLVPILVQFGGQTPLNLAMKLKQAGVPIWGTSPEAIALAEDREQFAEILRELDIPQPENGTAMSLEEAKIVAKRISYPVLVRPSYVLGGRAMGIVYGEDELREYIEEATRVSPDAPVLIDRYLEDSFELDVDAVGDGERVTIGGIMEQIEEAGVHSGDSACMMPPLKVSAYHLDIIRDYVKRIGLRIGVRGLMNVQFAIKDEIVYVLEVNPRASRTTPFVSKATGAPLAKIASRVAAGQTLEEIGFLDEPELDGFFVKEVVLPFNKFPGAFVRLGPEMRSTGEVMGHASSFGHAYAKAAMGAYEALPTEGKILLTVNDNDKANILKIARDLHKLGFEIVGTRGTAEFLCRFGVPTLAVNKVSEGSPHVVDLINAGEVGFVVSTPLGGRAYTDGQAIRAAAIQNKIPLLTTLSAASAAVSGIRALKVKELKVRSLQEHHEWMKE
jgi:carbamoyl-phosphate synthase large subunit